MDLTPLAPSAGPIGGDGVAFPAGTISLTNTSFVATALDMRDGADSVSLRSSSQLNKFHEINLNNIQVTTKS